MHLGTAGSILSLLKNFGAFNLRLVRIYARCSSESCPPPLWPELLTARLRPTLYCNIVVGTADLVVPLHIRSQILDGLAYLHSQVKV